MQSIDQLDVSGICGVLTDIDDTLTEGGRLNASTLNALHQLQQAGLKIVPVTGRSSGWGHMVMSTWPVDAVVAESGGCWFTRGHAGQVQLHLISEAAAQERKTLQTLCEQLVERNPPLRFALDNQFRCVDVAIDFNENVTNCAYATITRVVNAIRAQGFNARTSSIHINAWSGSFDKGPTALALIKRTYPDLADVKKWVFIGDAPNDESMFGLFPNSVAVANFLDTPPDSLAKMKHHPAYITTGRFGNGFEQLAQQLEVGVNRAQATPLRPLLNKIHRVLKDEERTKKVP